MHIIVCMPAPEPERCICARMFIELIVNQNVLESIFCMKGKNYFRWCLKSVRFTGEEGGAVIG